MTKSELKDLTYEINGAAITVHKELGPGLLESVYQRCMAYELWHRGINFKLEMSLPVKYKMIELETTLRCDLYVEDSIVVELKACEKFNPVHTAQLLTYMKLLKAPKGILLNFNSFNLYKDGQRTLINEYFEELDE